MKTEIKEYNVHAYYNHCNDAAIYIVQAESAECAVAITFESLKLKSIYKYVEAKDADGSIVRKWEQ